jgi:hypothetical protein
VYIPNEVVGGIIGKGGVKINEIRAMSGAQVIYIFYFRLRLLVILRGGRIVV